MSLREFSYTAELEKAAQSSRWSDCISQVRTDKPEFRGTGDLPVNVFEERHMLTTLLEFNEVLYYFFLADSTKEGKNKEFRLSIQSFKKKDGEHLNSYIDGFKGTPTCITTGLLIFSNN
jgi:hypothetical protein